MRKFIIFSSLLIGTMLFWILSFPHSFDKEAYLPDEILAKSIPLNVKIDIDLIKSLGSSAYE